MSYENITKESNFYQSAVGDYGFKVVSSSESTSESCRAIQAIETSVVTTTTSVGDALSSITLVEGTIVFGKFDSISVTTGKVLAYKAS